MQERTQLPAIDGGTRSGAGFAPQISKKSASVGDSPGVSSGRAPWLALNTSDHDTRNSAQILISSRRTSWPCSPRSRRLQTLAGRSSSAANASIRRSRYSVDADTEMSLEYSSPDRWCPSSCAAVARLRPGSTDAPITAVPKPGEGVTESPSTGAFTVAIQRPKCAHTSAIAPSGPSWTLSDSRARRARVRASVTDAQCTASTVAPRGRWPGTRNCSASRMRRSRAVSASKRPDSCWLAASLNGLRPDNTAFEGVNTRSGTVTRKAAAILTSSRADTLRLPDSTLDNADRSIREAAASPVTSKARASRVCLMRSPSSC